MANNPRDPSWVRPNNPLGLAQLAGLSGVSGQNNDGHHWENRTAGFYASNYTSWFGDRLGTLAGLRTNENFKRTPNITATVAEPWAESTKSNRSYNLGANFRLTDWLRPYYSVSSTYNTALVNANDPLGNAPRPSTGIGQEAGLKFTTRDGRLSGSIQAFTTDSKDEMINAGTGVRDLVNPTGLNGAHNGPAGAKNHWVNLDRTTRGLEVILTASPLPNWRIRLAATSADGRNLTDKRYPMLWNDQFFVKNGAVTYQNGTPFLVPTTPSVITANVAALNRQTDPATLQGQGTWEPLTVAMMNDKTGPYWAQPADDNGRLQTSNLRRVLQYFVGPNGTALTGVTGLPLSAIPYFWSDPNGSKGETVVAKKGEYTVGYAQYRFVFTNNYSFTGDSPLKGFGIGGTLALGLRNRTFYYNTPGGGRELFSSPNTWQVNLITSYRRRIGKRFEFATQVNVENVFNHYTLGTLPNNGSGFTVPANLAVTFYGQPRMYVWTNSLSF
jgi:outer membrane receptor protein involved in Fe transport